MTGFNGSTAFTAACATVTGDRPCLLVAGGANVRGEKHFLAIEDCGREPTQSWREVSLGKERAPSAVAPGASGVRDPFRRTLRGGCIVTGHGDSHRPPTGALLFWGTAPGGSWSLKGDRTG